MVMVIMKVRICQMLCQLASRHWLCGHAGIYAGLIKGKQGRRTQTCRYLVGSGHRFRHGSHSLEKHPRSGKYGSSVCRLRQPWYILPCGSLTVRLRYYYRNGWHQSCRLQGSCPQPTQFSWFTCIFPAASSKTRPPLAHSFWQRLQPRHLRSLIYGFPLQCCSVFPAREPQPCQCF